WSSSPSAIPRRISTATSARARTYTRTPWSFSMLGPASSDGITRQCPMTPHDWDLTQGSPLFSTDVKGEQRRLVAVVWTDGLLHVLDRDRHEHLYEVAVLRRQTPSRRSLKSECTSVRDHSVAYSGTAPPSARERTCFT